MNKKAIISIVVIILIIIAVVFVSKRGKNTAGTTDGKTSVVDTSSATSTSYANGTYGLSFTYPEKYVADIKTPSDAQGKRTVITLITRADKALLSQIQGPAEGPTSITVEIFEGAAKKQTLASWVRNTKASNFALAPSKKYASTTILSLDAVTYSWDGLFPANTIVFAYRDNIIMATMTYLTPQDAIWKDFGTVLQSIKLN